MKQPGPNFDRIARPYRWLEYLTLGPALQRIRTHHLPCMLTHHQALILGDGDGRFTAELLRRNPHLNAEVVDLSQSMLALLSRRVATAGASSRLCTRHHDARSFSPTLQPDIIVTHFFLDCLTQLEVDAIIGRLAPCIAPGGLWLFSDFRIPRGFMHWPARFYIRSLYLAFSLLTGLRVTRLPDHATPLTRAGFRPIATHKALFGLLTSELWQAQTFGDPLEQSPHR